MMTQFIHYKIVSTWFSLSIARMKIFFVQYENLEKKLP